MPITEHTKVTFMALQHSAEAEVTSRCPRGGHEREEGGVALCSTTYAGVTALCHTDPPAFDFWGLHREGVAGEGGMMKAEP